MSEAPHSSAVDVETPSNAVDQCLVLLRAKDDTSRFVGLTMLLPLLKHNDERKLMGQAAQALDPRFLDRLLRSSTNFEHAKSEATALRGLAISILHAFAILLSKQDGMEIVMQRVPSMINILPACSEETTTRILETFLAVSEIPQNALMILEKSSGAIIGARPLHPLTLKLVRNTLASAATDPETVQKHLGQVLRELVLQYQDQERSKRIEILLMLSQLLVRISPECFPADNEWTECVYELIEKTTFSGPSQQEREYCITITNSFLLAYPSVLLFGRTSGSQARDSEKPFLYLFIQLITIDVRASFSMLIELLGKPEYADVARKQARSLNIIAEFLMFLLRAEDFDQIGLPPDTLLRLRTDIGETFSLGMEFLRDLWDRSSCIPDAQARSSKDHSPEKALESCSRESDPLVVGIIKALSLWLREDEGLQKEAAGLTDIFVDIWKKRKTSTIDYRPWIIAAFDGMTEEKLGREHFLEEDAWKHIWEDLKETYVSGTRMEAEGLRLAIDEATLLAAFVRQLPFNNMAWAIEVGEALIHGRGQNYRLQIAVMSLASACLACSSRSQDPSQDGHREAILGNLTVVKKSGSLENCEDWVLDMMDDIHFEQVDTRVSLEEGEQSM